MELFKGDAVSFFGVDKKIVSATRTELTQLHLQRNIDDWIFLADDDTFLHFEFQTTDKKEDLPRFMVSDAMLCYKEGKPVKTIVVYSSDIERTNTILNYGAIQYQIEAFYMVKIDGDKRYDELKRKVETRQELAKQDLMSIVFLPLMRNSVDKLTRLEQSIELSKELKEASEQLQIQAMLDMLAEKFIKDKEQLAKLKELMNMTAVAEMIANDKAIEIAKNMLKDNEPIEKIIKYTSLDESTIKHLQTELNNE